MSTLEININGVLSNTQATRHIIELPMSLSLNCFHGIISRFVSGKHGHYINDAVSVKPFQVQPASNGIYLNSSVPNHGLEPSEKPHFVTHLLIQIIR